MRVSSLALSSHYQVMVVATHQRYASALRSSARKRGSHRAGAFYSSQSVLQSVQSTAEALALCTYSRRKTSGDACMLLSGSQKTSWRPPSTQP